MRMKYRKRLFSNGCTRKILTFYVFILLLVTSFSIFLPSPSSITIEFKNPTPADGNYTNKNFTVINVSIATSPPSNVSSFIDWNRSLVGYWNFEYTNNTHVFDNSTHWNNATCISRNGSSNITAGKYGDALYFNGSSNEYLDCGNNNSLNITGEITIEAWIREFETTFEKTYDTDAGALDDKAYYIEQTYDGGYIIVGMTNYTVPDTSGDLWLIKTDSNGRREWDKTFGGSKKQQIGYCVRQTDDDTDGVKDDGYIIMGAKWKQSTTKEYNENDLWLIKTDSNGKQDWNTTFGGPQNETAGGGAAQQTADGGYIIASATQSHGTGTTISGIPYYDLWLLKTDGNGDIFPDDGDTTFNKTYGLIDKNDVGLDVEQVDDDGDDTKDNGFIITGYKWGDNNYDLWALKTNSTGYVSNTTNLDPDNITFNLTYGLDQALKHDGGSSVQQTTDKGYIITGYTKSYGAQNETINRNLWLLKLNSTGDDSGTDPNSVTGNWTFGQSVKDDEGLSVQQTTDGGYIVTGYTESFKEQKGTRNVWIMKFNETLTRTHNMTFGLSKPGEDVGNCVKQTNDGGFIVAGTQDKTDCDVYIIKTDATCNLTESNNNQSLNKTIIGKGRDAYQLELQNGTFRFWK